MPPRPMPGDVDAPRDPDILEPVDVVEEPAQRRNAARPPDQAAMQAHRHHPGRTPDTFLVERVETVAQVGLELVARVEPLRRGEAHVVGIQRVGDDQLLAPARLDPVGQVVGVAVRDIVEAAILGDQAHGVLGTAPGIPAARGFARDGGVQPLGRGDLRALLGLGHVLVLDPLQPVACDLPAGLLHGGDLVGAARQRAGDPVDGHRQPAFGEQAVQPPEPGPRAVFVDRLHVPVPLPRPSRGPHDLAQEGLRGRVAVQHAILAAFLVVDDELHRDPGPAGPVGRGRIAAVAGHVSWVKRQGDPPDLTLCLDRD